MFFYWRNTMKPNIIKKIYIYIHMKYCELTHQKFLKNYIVIFKYKNKIGYFTDAIGLNKKDVIEKTRMVVYHSGFFNGLKDMKKIQVIAIEREDKLWISI